MTARGRRAREERYLALEARLRDQLFTAELQRDAALLELQQSRAAQPRVEAPAVPAKPSHSRGVFSRLFRSPQAAKSPAAPTVPEGEVAGELAATSDLLQSLQHFQKESHAEFLRCPARQEQLPRALLKVR